MTSSVETLRTQCFQWLRQRFGTAYTNRQNAIVVPFDRTAVFVAVEAKTKAVQGLAVDLPIRINFSAPVLVDVPVTPELTYYIAMNGGNFLFGGLSLYQDNGGSLVTVEFGYSIFGEAASQSNVEMSVALAFGSAETEQKKMRPLFGGISIMER